MRPVTQQGFFTVRPPGLLQLKKSWAWLLLKCYLDQPDAVLRSILPGQADRIFRPEGPPRSALTEWYLEHLLAPSKLSILK